MKKLLLITGFALSTCFSFGQYWTTVGAPFNGNICGCVYAMSCMAVYDGKLYAGGFATNGIVTELGSWDGVQWDTLGAGIKLYDIPSVNSMIVYNGKLIVGGFYTAVGNITPTNSIGAWNGSKWSAIGSGVRANGYPGTVNAMAVYNGELYVGGSFDSAGGIPVNNIAKWNGTSWSDVGGGINKLITASAGYSISAMAIYNGALYVGGFFDSAGGKVAHNIAEWNGSAWLTLGNGIHNGTLTISSEEGDYWVSALCVYNKNLYVGGMFDSAGTVPAKNIAVWNGSVWSALGNGMGGSSSTEFYHVNCLYDIDSVLIAGGAFNLAGSTPANYIAEWNGSTWKPFGAGVSDNPFASISGPDSVPHVNAVMMYNNNLYVAGMFDSAGSVYTGCIAQWNGPVSVNELSSPNDNITVYPNPSNGIFYIQMDNTQFTMDNEKTQVEVYNVLGEKVYSSSLSIVNSPLSIDLSNQVTGIYLYRVIDETGKCIVSGKLIKE